MTAVLLTVTLVLLSTLIALVIGVPWGWSLAVLGSWQPTARPAKEDGWAGEADGIPGVPLWAGVSAVGRFFIWGALVTMLALPLYVHAAGWESFLGKFGWLPTIGGGRRFSFQGIWPSSWIHGVYGGCWVAVTTFLGCRFSLRRPYEAALLQHSPWGAQRSIVLPLAAPWIAVGLIWSAVVAATEMTVADLYMVRTLSDEVYKYYALQPDTVPITLALLVPAGLFLPMIAVLYQAVFRRGLAQTVVTLRGGGEPALVSRPAEKRLRIFAWCIATLVAALTALVPLASLLMKAGWEVTGLNAEASYRVSLLKAFQSVVNAPNQFQSELTWSFYLGILLVVVSLPIAAVLAAVVHRQSRARAVAFWGMLGMLLIPGPVLSMMVIWLFNRPALGWVYDNTLIPTIAVLLPRTLPIAYLLFRGSTRLLDQSISDSVRLQAASRFSGFWRGVLPRQIPAIGLAGLAVFLVTVADLSATLLVLPPSVSTVAVRLFGLMHSGVRNQEAGLALITIISVGLITATSLKLLGWKSSLGTGHLTDHNEKDARRHA